MARQLSALATLLLVTLACSSGARRDVSLDGTRGAVGVAVRQHGPLFFGSDRTGTVFLSVDVHNRSASDIVVRRVRVESSGTTQYVIYPEERIVRETVSPGSTRQISLAAQGESRTRGSAHEPLTVRAVVFYESNGKHGQQLYIGHVLRGD